MIFADLFLNLIFSETITATAKITKFSVGGFFAFIVHFTMAGLLLSPSPEKTAWEARAGEAI